MSRRTTVMALTGLVLVTGLGAPALAASGLVEERDNICLRLDPENGEDGFCVWLPPTD